MDNQDIRWIQRFQNFKKAFEHLDNGVKLANQKTLSDLEEQGLIQRFEFTHELAWKVLKDYFEYQGNSIITGSRDSTREAFANNLIIDGEGWMDMIKSRNLSSHTYDEVTVKEIVNKIIQIYHHLFLVFIEKMNSLSK